MHRLSGVELPYCWATDSSLSLLSLSHWPSSPLLHRTPLLAGIMAGIISPERRGEEKEGRRRVEEAEGEGERTNETEMETESRRKMDRISAA